MTNAFCKKLNAVSFVMYLSALVVTVKSKSVNSLAGIENILNQDVKITSASLTKCPVSGLINGT